MAYIPKHISQVDGSTCQWTNCWATIGAWAARGASRNAVKGTPAKFRKWARRPDCQTGGLGDIARGLGRKGLWGKRVTSGGKRVRNARYLDDHTKAKMRTLFSVEPKGGGKLYVAESDFNVWPVKERCSATFGNLPNAYHMIGIVPGEGKGRNKGKVRVEDPLCHRYNWINVDRVIRAIITYNNEHGEKRDTADLIVVNVPDRE